MSKTYHDITTDERDEGLKKALEVRRMHAAIKNAVRTKQKSFSWALGNPDSATIRVYSLLLSVPGIGKARAEKILNEAGVMKTRRVQGLGCNQRVKLIELVEG